MRTAMHRLLMAAMSLLWCAGTAAVASDAGALADADRTLGEAAAKLPPAEALASALAPDCVVLLDGARFLFGRVAVESQAAKLGFLAGRALQWQPLRAEVAADGAAGFTWGVVAALANEPRTAARFGRYLAVWRHDAQSGWRAVAWALLLPQPFAEKPGDGGSTGGPPAHPAAAEPLLRADEAFAKLAEKGAGAAFGAYAAPDAAMFGGRGIALRGPQEIAGAFAGWAPTTRLEWQPVHGWIAGSGDLGFTVGEAVHSQVGEQGAVERSGSKYLTIWRRQPDGAFKFVIDGGNSRPLPPR